MMTNEKLKRALSDLINTHGIDNDAHTADFVLAELVMKVLGAYVESNRHQRTLESPKYQPTTKVTSNKELTNSIRPANTCVNCKFSNVQYEQPSGWTLLCRKWKHRVDKLQICNEYKKEQ